MHTREIKEAYSFLASQLLRELGVCVHASVEWSLHARSSVRIDVLVVSNCAILTVPSEPRTVSAQKYEQK